AGIVAALTSASAIDGAMLMAAFGLGTLPNLLALGWSADRVARWLQNRWTKAAAAALIIAFGIMGLLRLDPTDQRKAADVCRFGAARPHERSRPPPAGPAGGRFRLLPLRPAGPRARALVGDGGRAAARDVLRGLRGRRPRDCRG